MTGTIHVKLEANAAPARGKRQGGQNKSYNAACVDAGDSSGDPGVSGQLCRGEVCNAGYSDGQDIKKLMRADEAEEECDSAAKESGYGEENGPTQEVKSSRFVGA